MGDLGQAVNMLFVMMAIVFLILILLIVIIKLMGIILGAFHNRGKGSSGSSGGAGADQGGQKNQPNLIAPVPAVENGIPEEVIAVIAAAVSAMDDSAGTRSVIRSVSRAKGQKNAWSMAGLLKSTNPFSL